MVCSAKLFVRDVAGGTATCPMVMPPIVLETTSAPLLLAALEERLPVTLTALAARSAGRAISGWLGLTKLGNIRKPMYLTPPNTNNFWL